MRLYSPALRSHTPASGTSSPPSLSALVVSLDTSPAPSSVAFPPSPALDTNLEPEPQAGYTSPYTPRKRRVRHSSLPSAPHPPWFAPGSSDKDKDEPDLEQPSPTVVLRNRAPICAPNFGPATAPALTSTSPTGTQAPPTLGSAATSAIVGSLTALQDAIAAVRELKRFNGKGQPIPEAEYRFYFLQATQGLADKEIAKIWVNSIEYKSPAHVWLDTLRNDPNCKDAVEKWSTLQPEIEKHWPSPPLDFDAQRDAYRRDWDEHCLNLQTLKEEIESGKAGTRPLQAWAEEHKARARIVNSTDEDRVSKTIRVDLHDGWLVNLLPKRDGYYDKFDDLMKDIAAISLCSLIAGWEQESVVTSMRSMSVALEPSPYTPPNYSRPSTRSSNTSWQPLAPPQTPAQSSTPRRQNTLARGVRFSPLVQVSQPEAPPPLPRPLPQTPLGREDPPHMPAPPAPPTMPQTPAGPVELVASRVARSGQPPPGATLVPDTPEARTQWRQRQQDWLNTHGQVWPELDKPYPLTPGTYEPTVPIEESLGDLERDYCKKARNALQNKRRAGQALGARVQTGEHGLLVGKRVGLACADGGHVDPNSVEPAVLEVRVGSGMDTNLGDRTVHFLSISSTCTTSESTISTPYLEQTVVKLGSLEREEGEEREWPFKIELELAKRVGEERKAVWGTVDGGAMLCVIDSTIWAQIEHWFGRLRDSRIVCRMANGSCVPSLGTGAGVIGYKAHVWPIRFEVINSRGAFELLLRKDWLHKAGAMQVFRTDSLALPSQAGTIVVKNKNPRKPRPKRKPAGPRLISSSRDDAEKSIKPMTKRLSTSDASEEADPVAGGQEHVEAPGEPVPRRSARLRKLAESTGEANLVWVEPGALEAVDSLLLDEVEESNALGPPDSLWQQAGEESKEGTMRGVLLMEPVPQVTTHGLNEVLRRADRNRARAEGRVDLAKITIESRPKPLPNKPPVPKSPRTSDPFGEKRVAEILQRVQIGEELTDEQRANVLPVDFTEITLDIPTNATFPKRTGQRKLSEPQRQALYTMLDKLKDANVIEKVTQDQVAAVSPINMVPKHGGADRTSLNALRRMANLECCKYGLPVKYPEAGFYEATEAKPEGAPAKWRLVQNFAAVNKVTQIRPFPMGDLAAKQRAVAGHRFVSVMDLQAGFHAIPIAPESVPYTGFYVEGRGHYVYRQMPFGLTGAPTTFCEMVAHAFHKLLGKILEVWMDDMATAADGFDTGMTNLRSIFERCRERKISLSASKTVLFMREATFAGAR
ncbi:hypothetical protein FRC07_014787, partial [Ceratobasidium sp. 392]